MPIVFARGEPTVIKRRKFIIDGQFRKPVLYWGIAAPATAASLSVAAIFLLLSDATLNDLSAGTLRWLMVSFAIAFALLAAAGTTFFAVLVTHRVVGAERVIRTALEGFVIGDHSRRLSLRKHDYLKDLAKTCRLVSLKMESREAILDALRKALDEGADSQRMAELLEREASSARSAQPVAV